MTRANPSRWLASHFGLFSAAVGVAIGMVFFKAGFHGIGMVVACLTALSVGDAWDAETTR